MTQMSRRHVPAKVQNRPETDTPATTSDQTHDANVAAPNRPRRQRRGKRHPMGVPAIGTKLARKLGVNANTSPESEPSVARGPSPAKVRETATQLLSTKKDRCQELAKRLVKAGELKSPNGRAAAYHCSRTFLSADSGSTPEAHLEASIEALPE